MKKVTMSLLILLLISIPITGYAYYQYLYTVPAYKQATDYTCWATCVTMVLKFDIPSGSYTEESVCKDYYNMYPHTGDNTNEMDVIVELQRHSTYDDSKIVKHSILDDVALNYQLGHLAPPIAHIQQGQTFHDVVIIGINNSDIMYNDPLDGTMHTKVLSDFNGKSGSSWYWHDAIIEA